MKRPENDMEEYRVCCGGNDDNLLDGCESAKALPHWSYCGPTGPEHWGDLDPRFAAAKTGRQQSPIDLADPFQAGAATAFFTYQAARLSVANNGHSIQVDCPPGSSISVGGRRYELLQYHFHTPSEHTVDGGFYESCISSIRTDRASSWWSEYS
jgi:carbonic anhydrase